MKIKINTRNSVLDTIVYLEPENDLDIYNLGRFSKLSNCANLKVEDNKIISLSITEQHFMEYILK